MFSIPAEKSGDLLRPVSKSVSIGWMYLQNFGVCIVCALFGIALFAFGHTLDLSTKYVTLGPLLGAGVAAYLVLKRNILPISLALSLSVEIILFNNNVDLNSDDSLLKIFFAVIAPSFLIVLNASLIIQVRKRVLDLGMRRLVLTFGIFLLSATIASYWIIFITGESHGALSQKTYPVHSNMQNKY